MKKVETTERKESFDWSALRTKVLIALVTLVVGVIGGYFLHANIESDARVSVVNDMQIVQKTVSKQ